MYVVLLQDYYHRQKIIFLLLVICLLACKGTTSFWNTQTPTCKDALYVRLWCFFASDER